MESLPARRPIASHSSRTRPGGGSRPANPRKRMRSTSSISSPRAPFIVTRQLSQLGPSKSLPRSSGIETNSLKVAIGLVMPPLSPNVQPRPRDNDRAASLTAGTDIAHGMHRHEVSSRRQGARPAIPQRAEFPIGVLGDADGVTAPLGKSAALGRQLRAPALPQPEPFDPAVLQPGEAIGLTGGDQHALERVIEGRRQVTNPAGTGVSSDVGEGGHGSRRANNAFSKSVVTDSVNTHNCSGRRAR